jgi:hypothetical protein
MTRKLASLAALAGLGLIAGAPESARADLIGFNGLNGGNGAPFVTYSEGLFTVTPSDSDWSQGFFFGNPVPAIFTHSSTAFVDVTLTNPGPFTFAGVDLANGGSGSSTYTIEGLLGGSPVLTESGSLGVFSFTTIGSPNASQPLDTLRISIDRGTTSSLTIDNIRVTAALEAVVPEPSTAIVAVFGAMAFLAYGWSRHRREQRRLAAA